MSYAFNTFNESILLITILYILICTKIVHIEAGSVDKRLDEVVDSYVPGEFKNACAMCSFPQKPILEPMPKGIDETEVSCDLFALIVCVVRFSTFLTYLYITMMNSNSFHSI